MSLMLRHRPDRFGLDPDPRGFVPLADLLDTLRSHGHAYVTRAHVEEVIATSDKRRFEIAGQPSRIRAVYGHSLERKITYQAVCPPEVLYHGTTKAALDGIMEEGLKSMGRQYVHLSATPDLARKVGQRRQEHPAILRIDAARANADGIAFYRADEDIYLVEALPPQYIEVVSADDGPSRA